MARRVGVLLAMMLLLWSAVFAGLIGLVMALHVWLSPHVGDFGAWAIGGAAVVTLGGLGVWLCTRALWPHLSGQASMGATGSIGIALELVEQYPIEAVCVAGVTGALFSSGEIRKVLVQELSKHFLESH